MATAKALNLTKAELPHSNEWTSTAQTPNTSAQTALGVKAVGCVRSSGGAGAKISTDPFGSTEIVGGMVTADVQSPEFEMNPSTSGLPSISSEVVMLKSAEQATDDLSAFASTPARGCLNNLLSALLKDDGEPGWKVASSPQVPPHLGTGSGGFGLRFVVTGKGLSSPLIDLVLLSTGPGRDRIDVY